MKKLVYLIVAVMALGLVVAGCIPVVPPTEQNELGVLLNRAPGELVLTEVYIEGRPQLLGTIKTDGFSISFDIRAIGQANDGDDIDTSKYYNATQFSNEYFAIYANGVCEWGNSTGELLKYNMSGGNTTPYWGPGWSDNNPLPAGVTFSQIEDGDDFVYAVSMSYAVLGISAGDTFPVQIKARDFNDDYVQSYDGYVGFDGEYSAYNGLWITDTGIFEVTLLKEVEIDIKPGSDPNSINLGSKGVVPVAILTTDDFDANDVDPDTVLFAGAEPVRWTMEDIDGDGDLDILFHFKTQELVLAGDSTEATLTGGTYGGTPIEGTDTVNIVPKK